MLKDVFIDEVKAAERSLYRVARCYLPTDADAADAVQEALTRAWAKRQTLRRPEYFRTWLTRILINVCKGMLRASKRLVPMAEPPPPAPRPPEGDALRDALGRLDAKHRAPLILFYLDGYSVREVAGMLNLPQGTVKNRLFRARKALKDDLLGEEMFDDEA